MKIGLVSEMGYDSKYSSLPPKLDTPRNCWEILSEEIPFYFLNYYSLVANPHIAEQYEVLLFIVPKSKPELMEVIFNLNRRYPNIKTGIIQEGPWWNFQEWPINLQAMYLKAIAKVDAFFAMSNDAHKYYSALAKKTYRVNFPVDIGRISKFNSHKRTKAIIIGGNSVPWYNGTTSILACRGSHRNIYVPSMGRNHSDIEATDWEYQLPDMRFYQLPYLKHIDWMKLLGSVELVVHLFPQCAGERVPMECAAVGTPCIGNSLNSVQMNIFPRLGTEVWNLQRAKELVAQVLHDKDFRDKQMEFSEARLLNYRPQTVVNDWRVTIHNLLSE